MCDDEELASDSTARENAASFADWNFETGLPDEDALQRMCRAAASLAVTELIKDIWIHIDFSDGRGAPPPIRLEVGMHAWDGAVTLGRPFAEVMLEFAQSHSYSDGEIDADNTEVLEIIRELETAIAMIKGRMSPREKVRDV